MEKNREKEMEMISDFNEKSISSSPYPLFIKFAASARSQGEVKTFSLLNLAEENLDVKNLGKEISVVFIKRGKFKLKNSNLSTNYLSISDKKNINLYEYDKEAGGRSIIDTGNWQYLKEKHKLSTFQYPYVYINNSVAKLAILPSSLGNYWEYIAFFAGSDKIYNFNTIISADKIGKKSPKGGEYFLMNFVKGEELTEVQKDNIFELTKELNASLKNIEIPQEEKDIAFEED